MGLGRNYRRLWLAAAISNVGDGVVLTAFPLLAAQLTRDPVSIANVAVLERLPWVLFSLVSGALVDRLDRRRVMASVDVVRGVTLAVVTLGIVQHWMSLPVLYGVVFVLGTAETLFDNAAQAVMPMVVPRRDLELANSRLYAANIVATQFAGPPIGSFLFAAAAAAPFLIDAGSFAASAVLVAAMAGAFRARAHSTTSPPPKLRADIKEGLLWLWRNPLLRTMAFSLGIFNLLWNGAYSILVLFALEALHVKAAAFGLLLAAAAAGSLGATFLATRISKRIGGGPALVLIGLVSGTAMVALAASRSAWVAGPLLAIDAFGGVVWNVITVSLRQSIIPEQLMGRVNSAYRLIGWGSIPVGAAIGGAVAKAFGIRAPFYAAGIVLLVTAVLLFRRMIPGIREAQSGP